MNKYCNCGNAGCLYEERETFRALLREVETYFSGAYDEHYQVELWSRISDALQTRKDCDGK